jgi:hypothetical protein
MVWMCTATDGWPPTIRSVVARQRLRRICYRTKTAQTSDNTASIVMSNNHACGVCSQRVRDAHIGVDVASNDDIVACREAPLEPIMASCQHGRGRSIHHIGIGCCQEFR